MEKPQTWLPRICLTTHCSGKLKCVVFYFCSSLLTQLLKITANKATFMDIDIVILMIRKLKKFTINTTSLSRSILLYVKWQHSAYSHFLLEMRYIILNNELQQGIFIF